jgi:hypothetical protein
MGQKVAIFFLELIVILFAIHNPASSTKPPKRLLVYTDSLDAVSSLHSLHAAESLYNGPLLAIAGIILNSRIDLRVRHIDDEKNICADLLSCLLKDHSLRFTSDRVHTFEPLRELLPVRWRECF